MGLRRLPAALLAAGVSTALLAVGTAVALAGTEPSTAGSVSVPAPPGVARAVRQTVSVDEGSVNFGQQDWPHDDDAPVTKTLTYRNGGTAPVALTLTVEGDTGVFSLEATSLTVPAGGTATTTVTADTSGESADGFKDARVVATAPGDVRVETPMVVNRGVEKYNVTIRHVGRDGEPSLNHYAALIPLDARGKSIGFWDYSSEQSNPVPKGTYGLFSVVYDADGSTMLVRTKLVVDGEKALTLDAREGRPVNITPPRTDARQATASVSAYWTGTDGSARWLGEFRAEAGGTDTQSSEPARQFEAGKAYKQNWNNGVFAPSVADGVDHDLAAGTEQDHGEHPALQRRLRTPGPVSDHGLRANRPLLRRYVLRRGQGRSRRIRGARRAAGLPVGDVRHPVRAVPAEHLGQWRVDVLIGARRHQPAAVHSAAQPTPGPRQQRSGGPVRHPRHCGTLDRLGGRPQPYAARGVLRRRR